MAYDLQLHLSSLRPFKNTACSTWSQSGGACRHPRPVMSQLSAWLSVDFSHACRLVRQQQLSDGGCWQGVVPDQRVWPDTCAAALRHGQRPQSLPQTAGWRAVVVRVHDSMDETRWCGWPGLPGCAWLPQDWLILTGTSQLNKLWFVSHSNPVLGSCPFFSIS